MKQSFISFKKLFQNKASLILYLELLTLFIITFNFLIYNAYTNTLNGDEREHIYASYLVHNGYLPYRDFFEHHHPLLWYVFQPIIYFFINSANIWYVARTFSLLLIILNCFLLTKISRLIYPSLSYAWLVVILSICPYCVFILQVEFRPDGLMMTTYLGGLYYYLRAASTPNKEKDLSLSFLFFFFSLAAIQKTCFLLIPFILLTFYLLYKHIFTIKNILTASIAPLLIMLLYISYLYQTDTLKDYFELNWLLNMKISFNIKYPVHETAYYYIANALALFTLLTQRTLLCKYIAFICLCLSLSIGYIFSCAFRHYWLPVYPFFALICAYYIAIVPQKIKTLVLACLILTISMNNINAQKEQSYFPKLNTFVFLTENVLKLANRNELIIGCIGSLGGLRLDATGYYWFGRNYIALLDNHYFNRHELPNGDKIVKTRHPKIVCAEDWTDCMTNDYKFTLDCHSIPTYDRDYLEKNYNNMGFIYVKK